MIHGINILGFIYDWRKAFLGLGGLALLWELGLGICYFYDEWHTKPMLQLKRDLNSSRAELRACENSRVVEVFETENRTVFDSYREKIEEMESEKRELNISDHFDSYEWMYH